MQFHRLEMNHHRPDFFNCASGTNIAAFFREGCFSAPQIGYSERSTPCASRSECCMWCGKWTDDAAARQHSKEGDTYDSRVSPLRKVGAYDSERPLFMLALLASERVNGWPQNMFEAAEDSAARRHCPG